MVNEIRVLISIANYFDQLQYLYINENRLLLLYKSYLYIRIIIIITIIILVQSGTYHPRTALVLIIYVCVYQFTWCHCGVIRSVTCFDRHTIILCFPQLLYISSKRIILKYFLNSENYKKVCTYLV